MNLSACLISQNDISREGLSAILSAEGFNVIGSVGSIAELDAALAAEGFLAIVDLTGSDNPGDSVQQLRDDYANAIVVVLSDSFDMEAMLDCFEAGAQGYISKSLRSQPLIAALRLASMGEYVFPSELAGALGSRQFTPQQPQPFGVKELDNANLSPREHDVLCCLMAGYPNKSIARHLDVCEATVKVHVKAILRKLNVRNRTQAAIWANSHNVMPAGQAGGEGFSIN